MKPKNLAVLSFTLSSVLALTACQTMDPNGGTRDAGDETAGSDTANAADAEYKWQMAHYEPPNSTAGVALEWWTDQVREKTDGRVDIEVMYAESLLPATDILSGVGAGRADLGVTAYIYHPTELPLSHITQMPYRTGNLPAEMSVYPALYESNEAFQNEFAKNDVRLMWWWSVPDNIIGCTEPVESLSDFEGRRIRAGGLVVDSVEAVGATAVTLTSPEVREGIERGLIDCWAGGTVDIAVSFGLHEVTEYVYQYGYGLNGAFQIIVGEDLWSSLPGDLQQAIIEVNQEVPSKAVEIHEDAVTAACAEMRDAGVELVNLPEEMQEEWKSLTGDSALESYRDLVSAAGEDADPFLEEYYSTLESAEAEYPDYENPTVACFAGEL